MQETDGQIDVENDGVFLFVFTTRGIFLAEQVLCVLGGVCGKARRGGGRRRRWRSCADVDAAVGEVCECV